MKVRWWFVAAHAGPRACRATAGARKGWSKLTVYEREFRLGHLRCKERCATRDGAETEGRLEADRFAAARAFDLGWQICTASWPGGSSFDLVKTSGGVPGGFVDHQRDTKEFWRRVEQAMGGRDWQICRRVCGENYSVAAAVPRRSTPATASRPWRGFGRRWMGWWRR